MLSVRKIR